jgi:hypothetical protein
MDKQRQKVEAVRKEYERVAAEQGENSKATQDLAIKLNNETAAMNKTEKQINESTKALNNLGKESKDAEKNTEKLSAAMTGMGKATKAAADVAVKAVVAVGAAAVAAAAGVFKLTVDAGKAADELITMSNKTGLTTDQLQEMEYAARFVDVEVETMSGSMVKLTKTMDKARDGNKTAAAAYETLGVQITNADGSLRNSKDVWLETIDALGGVANETERDALAMEIFGKSAQDLNPLIKAGAKELGRLGQEAKDLGLVLDSEAVASLGAFDDKMQKLEATTKGIGAAISIAALPAMDALVSTMQKLSEQALEAVKTGDWSAVGTTIKDAMTGAAQGITDLITNIAPTIVPILSNLVQTIADTIPTLLPVIIDTALLLLDTFINFIVDNSDMIIDTGITALLKLIDGIIAALPKLIPAALQIIVKLAAGIIAALPQLIAMIPQIYSTIKETLATMDWGKIGADILQGLSDGAASALKIVTEALQPMFDSVNKELEKWTKIGESLLEGLKKAFDKVVEDIKKWATLGGQIVDGIIQGIKDAGARLVTSVKNMVNDALNSAKKALGIQSPSKVFRNQVGVMIGEGMALGIQDSTGTVNAAMKKLNGNLAAEGSVNLNATAGAISKTNTAATQQAAGKNFVMNVTLNVRSAADAVRELDILSKQLAASY